MKPKLVELYEQLLQQYQATYALIVQLNKEAKQENKLEECADAAFAYRECEKLAKDLRKEFTKGREKMEQLACLLWIKRANESASYDDKIKTDFVTATPNVGQAPALPRRGDPEFFDLIDWMGVPKELFEGEHDPIRLHWPGMVELIASHSAEGKPIPKGCDASTTHTVYSLKMRKRNDVNKEISNGEN